MYLEEAKKFADTADKISLLAIRFLEIDKDKEKEKVLEITKLETKYSQREAYLLSKLAPITQRYIMIYYIYTYIYIVYIIIVYKKKHNNIELKIYIDLFWNFFLKMSSS